MTGTLLNAATVVVGGAVGALVGERLPAGIRQTVMHAIGLMTLLIGFQMALGTKSAIIVLGSVVLGAVAGELLRIDDGIRWLGDWLEARVTREPASQDGYLGSTPSDPAVDGEGAVSGSPRATGRGGGSLFSRGFVTASLVFCVGPMTILGSFQDGLTGVYDTLAVKSVLDGFTALALASSLGWGVAFSALFVLVYQGALTFGAGWAKPFLSDPVVLEMTAAGGLLIVGIGLNILELARIRVANMLPSLAIAPLLVFLLGNR